LFCPRCGAEYRSGIARCPDCDVELVHEPPTRDQEIASDVRLGPDLVRVYSSPNPTIAHLVEGILTGEGIECAVYGGPHGAYPVTVGALSEVFIYVRPADARRARALIEAAERGDFAVE
jgi:Putative prokaryotic signal transducing protein